MYRDECQVTYPNCHDELHIEVVLPTDACSRNLRSMRDRGTGFQGEVHLVDGVAYFERQGDMLAWFAAADHMYRRPATTTPAPPCPQLIDDAIVSRQQAI